MPFSDSATQPEVQCNITSCVVCSVLSSSDFINTFLKYLLIHFFFKLDAEMKAASEDGMVGEDGAATNGNGIPEGSCLERDDEFVVCEK